MTFESTLPKGNIHYQTAPDPSNFWKNCQRPKWPLTRPLQTKMTLDLTSPYQTEMTSVKTIAGQNDLWKYIPEGEYTLPDRARPRWLLEKLSETELTSDKTVPRPKVGIRVFQGFTLLPSLNSFNSLLSLLGLTHFLPSLNCRSLRSVTIKQSEIINGYSAGITKNNNNNNNKGPCTPSGIDGCVHHSASMDVYTIWHRWITPRCETEGNASNGRITGITQH